MTEHPMHKDRWERRPGIDLWSIPHFLFGLLMGAVPSLFGTTVAAGVAAAGVLAVAWEVGEWFYGIKESSLNVVMDIILAVFGCALVAFGLASVVLSRDTIEVLTGAVFAVYMYTNVSGWLAYRRRSREFRR